MKNIVILIFVLFLALSCSKKDRKEVVVYTSVDQVFSEPILKAFEKETGIRVKVAYDVEAAKTTGLFNRLLAEKDRPQCDVFWNGEVVRTILLKKKGLLTSYKSPSGVDIPSRFKDKDNCWTGFAVRARVLIYNTKMLGEEDIPKSIFELTHPKWKAKIALSNPLFGTTATHIAALYAAIGQEKTEAYLKELKMNGAVIVDGNSVARDLVAEGKLPLAFTDTDDVNVAIQSGKPVKMIFPDSSGIGTFLIPNTVALIKNCPHPREGRLLIDYLLSRDVERKLAFSESVGMLVRDNVERPSNMPGFSRIKSMNVDYDDVAESLEKTARFCRDLFVR